MTWHRAKPIAQDRSADEIQVAHGVVSTSQMGLLCPLGDKGPVIVSNIEVKEEIHDEDTAIAIPDYGSLSVAQTRRA